MVPPSTLLVVAPSDRVLCCVVVIVIDAKLSADLIGLYIMICYCVCNPYALLSSTLSTAVGWDSHTKA